MGIAPLLENLRDFALGIGHAALLDQNPAKTLDSILHGPPGKSNRAGTGRSFSQRMEIAAAVQRLRGLDDENMTVEDACERVAKCMHLQSGPAARRIYERERKTESGKSLIRLIAAGLVEP
jgi:hypothetical protein